VDQGVTTEVVVAVLVDIELLLALPVVGRLRNLL
jgi:hypothetical protein